MNWDAITKALKEFIEAFLPQPLPELKPVPVTPTQETNAQKVHEAALSYLGRDASPSDIADDELGCAESVSAILRDVYPDFPLEVSTIRLAKKLKADKRFKAVLTHKPGTIIISPTQGKVVGHCGIFGEVDGIMSNNSKRGIWEFNYTLSSWLTAFRTKKKLGMPLLFDPL